MKNVIFMGLVLYLAGCMSGRHTVTTITQMPNGTVVTVVKETQYNRFGDQTLSGVEIHSDPNGGLDVSFEKQQSEARLFTDAMTVGVTIFRAGMAAAK
jgi:hypothetical protein